MDDEELMEEWFQGESQNKDKLLGWFWVLVVFGALVGFALFYGCQGRP